MKENEVMYNFEEVHQQAKMSKTNKAAGKSTATKKGKKAPGPYDRPSSGKGAKKEDDATMALTGGRESPVPSILSRGDTTISNQTDMTVKLSRWVSLNKEQQELFKTLTEGDIINCIECETPCTVTLSKSELHYGETKFNCEPCEGFAWVGMYTKDWFHIGPFDAPHLSTPKKGSRTVSTLSVQVDDLLRRVDELENKTNTTEAAMSITK